MQIDRSSFELAKSLAIPFNELTEAVSRDSTWLIETLKSACEGDPFTARLVELLKNILASGGVRQSLHLGILRSDYMLDEGPESAPVPPQLRQIELNTISCSFPALSSKLSLAHRAIVSRFGRDPLRPRLQESEGSVANLPPNDALRAIAAAISAAHREYLGDRWE